MDAERRHELKQNELAEAIDRIRDFSDTRTLAWAGVLLAIVIAWLGYRFVSAQQETNLANEFAALAALDITAEQTSEAKLAQLREFVAQGPSEAFEGLARLKLARALVIMAEKTEDPALLNQAAEQYEAIRTSATATPAARAGALFQLAQIAEEQRQFERAREHYEALVNNPQFAATAFDRMAETALLDLDDLPGRLVLEPGMAPTPAATSAPLSPGVELPAGFEPMPGPPAGFNANPPALPPPGGENMTPEQLERLREQLRGAPAAPGEKGQGGETPAGGATTSPVAPGQQSGGDTPPAEAPQGGDAPASEDPAAEPAAAPADEPAGGAAPAEDPNG